MAAFRKLGQVLSLVALLGAATGMLDFALGTGSEPGLRAQHAAYRLWTLVASLSSGVDPAVRAAALAVAAIAATGLAAAADRLSERSPAWAALCALPVEIAAGVPALLVTLFAIAVGFGGAPSIAMALSGSAAVGFVLGRRRSAARAPAGGSGLRPARWAADHVERFALFAGIAAAVAFASELRTLPSPAALSRGAALLTTGLALLLPSTRRTLSVLAWEPLLAGAGGFSLLAALGTPDGSASLLAPLGFSGGVLGTLGGAAGHVPFRLTLRPLRLAIALLLPAACGALAAAGELAIARDACGHLGADPRLARLGDPGPTGALAYGDGGALLIGGADRVLRWPRDGGEPLLLGLDSLAGAPRGDTPPSPSAWAALPGGNSLLAARGAASSLLVELDPADLDDGALAAYDDCAIGSVAAHEPLGLLLLGCADRPSVAFFEPRRFRVLAAATLPGDTGVASLAVDPGGDLWTLRHGRSPFLVRSDIRTGAVLGWRFVSASADTLAADRASGLHVAPSWGRALLSIDAESEDVRGRTRIGLGTSALLAVPSGRWVFAASAFDGKLWAAQPAGLAPPRSLRVGPVSAMALSADGGRLALAGRCGLLEIDLDRWLAADDG